MQIVHTHTHTLQETGNQTKKIKTKTTTTKTYSQHLLNAEKEKRKCVNIHVDFTEQMSQNVHSVHLGLSLWSILPDIFYE